MTGRRGATLGDHATPFVEGGGMQTYPQPYTAVGTRFYGFLLEADATRLRALCNKYLNGPAQGHVDYHPLVPRVVLGVADIPRFNIGAADNRPFWTPEIDVAFWVPVVAVKRVAGIDIAERFAWFLPYVFVDNTWAFASGREVYGFPKEIGTFHIPRSPTDAALFTLDTLAVKQYDPACQARVERLLTLRRVGDGEVGALDRTWSSLKEAFEDLLRMLAGSGDKVTLPGIGLAIELFDFLVHHEYPMVFLKQFRDTTDGMRACYLAIIEAMTKISNFHKGGWLAGQYELTLEAFASHPIAQELGMKASPQPVLAAAYMEFDFVTENGKVLWKA
jgi:hypothetical protein